MALDTKGSAVQVGIIDEPFAQEFALVASGKGDFSMADTTMNPLDVFHASSPSANGTAVIVLNCVAAPLTALDCLIDQGGDQLSYPATQNPFPSNPTDSGPMHKNHVIPASRHYPFKYSHFNFPSMDPPFLAGLGVYRFQTIVHQGAKLHKYEPACRAMKFSYHADGSGPFIGIAFTDAYLGVTADLVGQQGDLATLFSKTVNNAQEGPVSASNTEITVWANWAKTSSQPKETEMTPLVVWVYDAAWPLP
jgi:hypothetical protein